MATVMDTAMVPNPFSEPCKRAYLEVITTSKPAQCAIQHHGQQFGASTPLATINLAGLLRLGGAIMIALAVAPLRAQSLPPATPPITSAEFPATPMVVPSFRFVPLVTLDERYTDNVAFTSSALAQRDWVTNAAAGLHVDYRGARAKALLDYRVNRLMHARQFGLDDTQHYLNANATLEAVEKWLFLDARASISQQNRSAFGVADTSDSTSANANRIETTTYQFSPYVRGQLANVAIYQLRATGIETRTGESVFPDTKYFEWIGLIKNAPAAGRIGWTLDGSTFSVNNSAIGKREDNRIRGTATFEVNSQLHFSLSGGKESSNLDGRQRRATTNHGVGMEWSPSERTQLAAVTQKRFFGYDHLVGFAHRTPLTAWSFASSKEVSISARQLGTENPGSVYNLLLDLLASSIPDPLQRAAAAQRKLEQTGIPTATGIQEGSLTVRPLLNRRQDASVALLGTRNTITLRIGRQEQRGLDGDRAASGIGAPIEDIRQSSANAAWAYRLSPVSTIRLVVSFLRTEGLFNNSLTTTQRFQSLFFVTQLGPRTSFSAGLRRTLFDSTVVTSYRENSVASSLTVRF